MTKIRMGQNVPHAFGACSQTMITIGLAGLLAWHSALSNFSRPSAGMAISPLFAIFFFLSVASGSLLLHASYRADSTLLCMRALPHGSSRASSQAALQHVSSPRGSCRHGAFACRCRRRWILLGVMRVLMGGNRGEFFTERHIPKPCVRPRARASAADLFFMHGGDVRSVIAAPFFGAQFRSWGSSQASATR